MFKHLMTACHEELHLFVESFFKSTIRLLESGEAEYQIKAAHAVKSSPKANPNPNPNPEAAATTRDS